MTRPHNTPGGEGSSWSWRLIDHRRINASRPAGCEPRLEERRDKRGALSPTAGETKKRDYIVAGGYAACFVLRRLSEARQCSLTRSVRDGQNMPVQKGTNEALV